MVARVIRTFEMDTPAGGTATQRVVRVLELPLPPARGQWLMLPDVGAPHRMTQCARAPIGATLTPGWKAAESVEVLLCHKLSEESQ